MSYGVDNQYVAVIRFEKISNNFKIQYKENISKIKNLSKFNCAKSVLEHNRNIYFDT